MASLFLTEGNKGFRGDINGLRAWAVAAVVLYHFGVPGFSGGFSGVDVFFVISGFLMAGIVIGGFERHSFALFDFYMARARRIVPALLVVVVTVLLVGAFILMPYDYQDVGRHARESVFFTSNLRYLSESGTSTQPPIRSGCYIPGRYRSSGSSTWATR